MEAKLWPNHRGATDTIGRNMEDQGGSTECHVTEQSKEGEGVTRDKAHLVARSHIGDVSTVNEMGGCEKSKGLMNVKWVFFGDEFRSITKVREH